ILYQILAPPSTRILSLHDALPISSLGTLSARWFFGALYYLLPNLANYSFIKPAAHGVVPDAQTILASLGYAIAYITVAERGKNRSEEHTSELQSQSNLVSRLLLEK